VRDRRKKKPIATVFLRLGRNHNKAETVFRAFGLPLPVFVIPQKIVAHHVASFRIERHPQSIK